MTGSQKYLRVPTRNFERWLKRLNKRYKSSRTKQDFQALIFQLLDDLCIDPRPSNSRLEPIPSKMTLPRELEFRKLTFAMPSLSGASGQGRLMYLVTADYKIVLVWIYTKEEFPSRPDEKSLALALQAALDSPPDQTDESANSEDPTNSSEDSNFDQS